MPGGGPCGASDNGLPVSSTLLRLDITAGQPERPPARISSGMSQECDSVMVTFTLSPDGSISYVTRHSGNSSNSPMPSIVQVDEKRRGGSQTATSPRAWVRPSGYRRRNAPPCLGSASTRKPKKYFSLNAPSVSACH